MQAQVPNPPYVGLWSRLAGFEFDELAQLVRDRRVTRLALMRSTIHLVTASDAHRLRAVLQPMVEQRFRSSAHAKLLDGGRSVIRQPSVSSFAATSRSFRCPRAASGARADRRATRPPRRGSERQPAPSARPRIW